MNRKKLLMWAMGACALAAALLPMLRIARILASAGVDIPSNDETGLLPRFLGQVLTGHYNWLHLPRDVYVNGHVVALPSLVYVVLARFDHLHLYPALFGSLLLDFVSLLLFYDAATFHSRGRVPLAAAVLLPFLSLMAFSVTQMSVFEYPLQTINAGLSGFGFALGIWGLTRWPGHTRSVAGAVAGGLIASFSYANGITLWLIFPAVMLLLGFKRRAHFAAVILGGAVSIGVYVYVMRADHFGGSGLAHIFNPWFVVAGIGRAFANDLNTSFAPTQFTLLVGAFCVVLLALELLIGWRQLRGPRHQEYVPAIAIAAFGLLSLLQVSMFRSLLAPWYTGLAMYVWIAVASLAYLLWSDKTGQDAHPTKFSLPGAAGISIVAVLAILAIYSNRSYTDKSFLLKNRAPVSAACMRYFGTAPTYCQQFMASWSPGRVSTVARESSAGPFLQSHGLSMFSPQQELTLQGDSIMNSVSYQSGALGSDVGWATGLLPAFHPFTDFLHLNLFLTGTARVEWTVAVPKNAGSAVFISAAATPGKGQSQIIPEVHLLNSAGKEQQIFSIAVQTAGRWYPFALPLDQYRGQTVTLRLDSGGAPGWTVYNHPRIELGVPGPEQSMESDESVPSNTDLSPSFQPISPDDLKFDLSASGQWTVSGLSPAGDDWSVTSQDPSITNVPELNTELDDYSALYIKMAASSNQPLGSFYAVLVTKIGDMLPVAHQSVIPLLADDAMHAYTFPLRLLNLAGQGRVRLVGISLHPMHNPSAVPANARVRIAECGLIRVRGGAR